MENSSSKQQNLFILNQGAIFGMIQVLFLTILYFADNLINSSWSDILLIIYLLYVYFSSRKYRNNYYNGFISYSKAFSYGFKIMALSGIVVGFFHFVLIKIDTELANEYVILAQDMCLQFGIPESQIEAMEPVFKAYSNPWTHFMGAIFSGVLWGVIVSLITSIFVKRKGGDPFQEIMKDV